MSKTKKKVLIVGISKTCGGIETLFYGLFGKEKSQVYDIEFVTFSPKCAFEDEYVKLGYKIHHLPSRRSNPMKFNRHVVEFYKSHNDYDYIWVNTNSTSLYQFQYFGKKYTSARIITHSHGTGMENTSLFTGVVNNILAFLNRRKALKSTDFFFGCSYAAGLALFGKKYEKNIIVVYNGADIKKFAYREENRRLIRDEFQIGNKITLLGMVGRIADVKNPLKMLNIFKDYTQINPDAKLIYVGKGELEKSLEEKIKEFNLDDKVIMAGFRTDVEKVFSGLDILMMPSQSEGMPLSAIEAQISGLPCVLSDTITREVAITDLVEYVPLDAENRLWSAKIENLRHKNIDRKEYADIALHTQFNIENTRKHIESIIK